MNIAPLAELITQYCRRMESQNREAVEPDNLWEYCGFLLEPAGSGHDVTAGMFGRPQGSSIEFEPRSDDDLRRCADAFVACLDEGVERLPDSSIQIEFERRPETEVLIRYQEPSRWNSNGVEARLSFDAADAPGLISELYDTWNIDSDEERQAQKRLRVPHTTYVHVAESIGSLSEDLARGRAKVAAAAGKADAGLGAIAERTERLLRTHKELFELEYERGDDIESLLDRLDAWHRDTLLAFRVLEDRAGTADFATPLHGDEYRLIHFSTDLALLATMVGRADIARSVLAHPAMSHTTYRPLDVLALIHEVPQASDLEADRFPIWEDKLEDSLWLKVAKLSPGRRQAAFEKLVHTWRSSLAKKKRLSGTPWAWGAALLAVLFDLDDGAVREVPVYPADLVDMARGRGVPPVVPDDIRLPGPWKKPTPPKVIEPEVRRDPLTIAGAATVADLAALLTPVGEESATAASVDAVLDAAIEAGTVVLIDWHGVDGGEVGALLHFACERLGLPAPGKLPGGVPAAFEKALPRFDAWLEPVGVRLIEVDTDTDEPLVAPVLVADHDGFIGTSGAGYRVRSMEQLAADNASARG